MAKHPAVPPAKKYPAARPHRAGDPALAPHDIVSETNQGPWPHDKAHAGYGRGISRAERKEFWLGPKDEYRETTAELSAGQREHRKRLADSGPLEKSLNRDRVSMNRYRSMKGRR